MHLHLVQFMQNAKKPVSNQRMHMEKVAYLDKLGSLLVLLADLAVSGSDHTDCLSSAHIRQDCSSSASSDIGVQQGA